MLNKTNEDLEKKFNKEFLELEKELDFRAQMYWKWYWRNFYTGLFLKVLTAFSLAILIVNKLIQERLAYLNLDFDLLFALIGVLISGLIAIAAWWDPWEKRKTFLIKGQELKGLSRELRLQWALLDRNYKKKSQLITQTENRFCEILKDLLELNDKQKVKLK